MPKETYFDLVLQCEIVELEVFFESFATYFFRKAKETPYLQLHRKGHFGITVNFNLNCYKPKNLKYLQYFLVTNLPIGSKVNLGF